MDNRQFKEKELDTKNGDYYQSETIPHAAHGRNLQQSCQ